MITAFGCGTTYPRCKEDCYWYREEQDMGAHIPYCNGKNKLPIEPDDCKECEQYHSSSKCTNADHIRSMNDEQLALFLNKCTADASLIFQIGYSKPSKTAFDWLRWLRKEKEK